MGSAMIRAIEIRDYDTTIAAIAINGTELLQTPSFRRIVRRGGVGEATCIYLIRLSDARANYDAHAWGDRTMTAAHLIIGRIWESLPDACCVDVRVGLGEQQDAASELGYASPTYAYAGILLEG